MNQKLKIMLFFVLISLISVNAQNPVQSFGDNLRSGAIANSIGSMAKNSIFLWYTTVSGELNPQYATQRKLTDSVLFFIIFFVMMRYGVNTVFPNMEKRSRGMISLAMAVALTIGFLATGVSIGFLLPYVNNLMFFVFVILLTFIINKQLQPKEADKKKPYLFIASLLIAIVLSWLIVNAFTLFAGKTPSIVGETFNTERKSDLSARIISGGSLQTTDPKTNYEYALAAVQNAEYDKAYQSFIKVLEYSKPTDPYYKRTLDWVSPRPGYSDKLFKHMMKYYAMGMEGELLAGEYYLNKVKASPADPQREDYLNKADAYLSSINQKNEILTRENQIRKSLRTSSGGQNAAATP